VAGAAAGIGADKVNTDGNGCSGAKFPQQMPPLMRTEIAQFAAKPLRAILGGRFWLSPVVSRLSPHYGVMIISYHHEQAGRYDEALEAWACLKARSRSREQAFQHTLRSARLEYKAGRYADSVKDYGVLHALNPGDEQVARGLESAALRAAREAQTQGRWLDACRMWAEFGRVTAKREKCRRNLRDCARYVSQSADTTQNILDSVEAWGLLRTIDPDSREARQGLEWCHVNLARAAERNGDAAAARKHWIALLEILPGDRRAQEALDRLDTEGREPYR